MDYRLAGDRVEVLAVASGYTAEEMAEGAEDKYGDKAVHRAFVETFAQ